MLKTEIEKDGKVFWVNVTNKGLKVCSVWAKDKEEAEKFSEFIKLDRKRVIASGYVDFRKLERLERIARRTYKDGAITKNDWIKIFKGKRGKK